jgi:hypothetical protein
MNRKEAVMAMLDGKKIKYGVFDDYAYFDKYSGFIYINQNSQKMSLVSYLFNEDGYEIYEEKKTEKIKLRNYIFLVKKNGEIRESEFTNLIFDAWAYSRGYDSSEIKLLKTETKEIEVEDE